MTTKRQTIITVFTAIYLLVVLFTDFSLTGFWTDVIFSIVIVTITLFIVFKRKTEKRWQTILLRITAILCSTVVYGLLILVLVNPMTWDTFKIRSFYYQKVDGRLFNAYFKPVGSYAGGEGNFWITESPIYFPLVETRKYYDRTVLWNFSVDEWDGERIDQNEVVKSYIIDEIIEKENNP
ncbi:MAG: hypothetical protein GQ574_07320 [Crocinitomix sp.]|nr:hypothetical protein [Crocinitomix sp.]